MRLGLFSAQEISKCQAAGANVVLWVCLIGFDELFKLIPHARWQQVGIRLFFVPNLPMVLGGSTPLLNHSKPLIYYKPLLKK